MSGPGPTLRALRWLRPLLPPAVLAAATLAGALSAPPRAATDGEGTGAIVGALDAEQLVQRYDRWFAGLDGGAALASRKAADAAETAEVPGTPAPQHAPADRRSAAAPPGPTIAACRSSSRSTPRTPSPAC
ncbi:MAG: hypothetical protein KF683_16945 [Rubrivivax sp.]|nr:hypothetical protein [Rubrivivax sp.]